MIKKKECMLFLIALFSCVFFSYFSTNAAPTQERIGGADRYETAVKISQEKWPQSNYVILVSGSDFPDALSSAPLAKKYDAPILLTEKDSLNQFTKEELSRLKVQQVFVVGGAGVIGESVLSEVQQMGITTTRISGENRYETAVKVAEQIDGKGRIVVVSGENFPDAISIASIAADMQMPILLTTKSELPEEVKTFLQNKDIETSYVIGGPAVVGEEVANQLVNSKRIYGIDRYETNIAILKEFESVISYNTIYTASGVGFADALTGSAVAAQSSSPIFLINRYGASVSQDFIKDKIGGIQDIKIFGGTGVIPGTAIRKLLLEKVYKVVLDPGHGGFDPGAIGGSGLMEKNVNLAVATKVDEILESNGVEVIMTRNSDILPWASNKTADLQTRSDISNEAEPDYFVSIHSNSSTSTAAKGTEVYYKNGNEEAIRLAGIIQDKLVSAVGTKNLGIKTENFSVLRKTNDPAILIELAFISNPSEEQLLGSTSFQNEAAQAIAEGILEALK